MKSAVVVAVLTVLSCDLCLAQPYPGKAIRFIVPYAPGGGTDITARAIAQKLTGALGQPVVVENRSGAGGIVGTDAAAKAQPDGYTIVIGTTGPLAINPSMYSKLPYDVFRDFAPISLIATAPHVLVVHPSLPSRSVKELVALAKRRPSQLTFSSGGIGGSNHLSAEMFNVMAQVQTVHVPYRGAGPAVIAVVSGEVSFAFLDVLATLPHVKSRRLRGLAVTGAKRSNAAPELPTMAEAGLPGYLSGVWYGILAPARTPKEIIDRLNHEVVRALRDDEIRARMTAEGTEVVASSPDEFAKFIKTENERWARVVRQARVRADS